MARSRYYSPSSRTVDKQGFESENGQTCKKAQPEKLCNDVATSIQYTTVVILHGPPARDSSGMYPVGAIRLTKCEHGTFVRPGQALRAVC